MRFNIRICSSRPTPRHSDRRRRPRAATPAQTRSRETAPPAALDRHRRASSASPAKARSGGRRDAADADFRRARRRANHTACVDQRTDVERATTHTTNAMNRYAKRCTPITKSPPTFTDEKPARSSRRSTRAPFAMTLSCAPPGLAAVARLMSRRGCLCADVDERVCAVGLNKFRLSGRARRACAVGRLRRFWRRQTSARAATGGGGGGRLRC